MNKWLFFVYGYLDFCVCEYNPHLFIYSFIPPSYLFLQVQQSQPPIPPTHPTYLLSCSTSSSVSSPSPSPSPSPNSSPSSPLPISLHLSLTIPSTHINASSLYLSNIALVPSTSLLTTPPKRFFLTFFTASTSLQHAWSGET